MTPALLRAGPAVPSVREHSVSPLRSSRYVVADQAVASFSNFLLTALAGRWLGPSEFGIFALVLASWLLVVGLMEAVVGDPLLVLGEEPGRRRRACDRRPAGRGGAAVPCVAVGLLFGWAPSRGQTLLVLAVFLPSLVLQQLWRIVGFQRGRPLASTVNDLVFLAVQVAALAAAFAVGGSGRAAAVGCWGLGALAASALGFRQFAERSRPCGAASRRCGAAGRSATGSCSTSS